MLTQRGYPFDVTIDNYEWRPATRHDAVALGKAVEGRYLEQFQPEDQTINKYKFQHSVLKCVDDKDSNLIQMADLLTGAVAFVRNGGLLRPSNVSVGSAELIDLTQRSYRGVRLGESRPFGPFGIWDFKDPGKPVRSPDVATHPISPESNWRKSRPLLRNWVTRHARIPHALPPPPDRNGRSDPLDQERRPSFSEAGPRLHARRLFLRPRQRQRL